MPLHNAFGRQRHLDDSAMAALWAAHAEAGGGACPDDEHLVRCAACRARYEAFIGWLSGLRDDAVSEADEAFPTERLAAQHSQILRRLEALERPARVIAFPRFTGRSALVNRGGARRWIAAAAAAGLIVGLGAGELLDFRRSMRGTEAGFRAAAPAVGQSAHGGVQTVSLTSDDAFFFDSDATAPRVEALQALDALTPRVLDLDQTR